MADRYASLKQGLVGCWIPSVSGSGLLLPDLSGRGNSGSLVGMDASDWVSGQYGRALDFDGSNDYVSFGGQASLAPSTITFAAWIMRTADWNFSGNIIFWAKPSGAYNGNGFYIEPNTASFSNNTLVVCDGFPNYLQLNQVGNTSFSLNTWTHFAFWIQNGSGQFYLNGLPAPTTVFGSLAITGTNDTKYLLHNSPGYGNFTPAKIDDVRIYNRALSESEIRLLSSEPGIGFKRNSSAFATRYAYKPAKPRNYSVIRNRDPNYSTLRQGLVAAYCPSISGQGNVLPDLVGGNHGTLTNMDASDWVSSGDGRALDFDGVNDKVTSTHPLGVSVSQCTFSVWMRKASASDIAISSIGSETANSRFHISWFSDGQLYCTVENGASSYGEFAPSFTSNFRNYCLVYDGTQATNASRLRVFLDGQQVSLSYTGTIPSTAISSNVVAIGAGSGSFSKSQQDDIRIYNRALTEPEIKLLASKRGIGLEPRKPKITFTDLGVQKTYSVVRVKETDYGNLRQGLVGAWCPSLPNGGGGNTLPDVSGYSNHGVLTNMSPDDWVSGQYGRALRINRAATRDQVNFGNVCHQPNDFSVSFFVNKVATGSTAYQNLWAVTRWNTGASMGTNEFCCLLTKDSTGTGDEPSFVVDIAGTGYRVESSAALRLGFFDHVCCVRLADTLSIYVNSINRGTTTGVPTTAIANNSRNLKLGDSDIASTDLSTNAMFNDIRIYNRALTEPEIRLLASRPGIGLRQDRDRNTFYQFPSGSRRRRILTGMP